MPEAGEYLLSDVGFSPNEKSVLTLLKGDAFVDFHPLGHMLTLHFDTSERQCKGWWNMITGERFACSDKHILENKYEQCPPCQKRTGFNPAFYHASSVSPQQEARNLEPHVLYLAHFGEGIVKVGISHAARGNSRLLEQGARSALILDTFPTAHIARQYEAKIAALPGIAETIQLRKKIAALTQEYHQANAAQELIQTRVTLQEALDTSFAQNEVLALNPRFFPASQAATHEAHDCTDHSMISGEVTGMLGSLLFCTQNDKMAFLPLKKYIGNRVSLSYDLTPIEFGPRQASLF